MGADPQGLSPATARQQLKQRAEILTAIRTYFLEQQVLEVETPLLGQYAVTDPQLENIQVQKPFADELTNQWLYLQTSPEYAMKMLLAKNSGSIYQLSKAFRQDQPGKLHTTEFTLLEWYRVGYNLKQLMQDVSNLVTCVVGQLPVDVISYRDAFILHAGLDPFAVSHVELCKHVRSRIDIDLDDDEDRDIWLDLLLTHFVEPQLGKQGLTFLVNYPVSQAALAKIKIDAGGERVAERFELYINGIEIANGYHELNDLSEHLERFAQDNKKRVAMGKPVVSIDKHFIAAVEAGIPDCAGVALGVDRLMLCALNVARRSSI